MPRSRLEANRAKKHTSTRAHASCVSWRTSPNKPLKQTAAPRRDMRRPPSRCHLLPLGFLLRPLLNGGKLARP